MADRIKGITIEIDGDAKGLSQALKGVNKDLKSTQTQLKDVEKLLKLDPHNVTLLGQKMELLGKEISQTKDKLSQLKSVSEQMEQGLKDGSVSVEQYQAWQREIIATENELKNLEDEIKKVPTASEAMISKVSEDMDALGQKISSVGDKISSMGDALMPVTAGITAVGSASIVAWQELDDAMDNVIAKTGASGASLEEMGDIVNSIATTIPTDFMTVSNAVAEVNTRFGVTGEELENLSSLFIKFSALNGTDVTASIDQVSSMMSAWGMDTNEAVQALNLLNGVGQNTGISVDNLANLMQDNALFFKEFNLTCAQSATLLGDMEKNGIDASVGVTALKTAMAKATADGKTLGETLRDFEWALETAGISETEKLAMAKDLFGGKAYAQIVNAMEEGHLSFMNMTGSMSDYSLSVTKTFEATLDPIDEFTTAMNELKILGAEIGEEVIPVLVDVLKDLKPILDSIKEAWESMSPEEQKELIENLGKLALVAPALSATGRAVTGLGAGLSMLGKAGKALSSLGIGAKISSIFGSGAGATAGASAGATLGTSLVAGLGGALAGGAVAKLLDNYVIAPIMDTLGNSDAEWYRNFTWFGDGGFFDEMFDFNSLQEALDVYTGAFSAMGADIKASLDEDIELVKTGFGVIGDFIKDDVTSDVEQVKTSFGLITDYIKSDVNEDIELISSGWGVISETTTKIWDGIKTFISDTWDGIKQRFTDFKDGISDTFQTIYDTIKGIWDSLGEMFQEGFDFKLPHISVTGGVAPYGIGGQGSLPKFNVDWYANGGILTSPTIFGMQNGRFLGGGEAGAEAVLPLSNLQTMIVEGMTQALGNGGDTVINVSIDNNTLGSVLLTSQQMMSLRRGK